MVSLQSESTVRFAGTCKACPICFHTLSLADTWTMPLASMSKVTSICGMPRAAGGMPTYMRIRFAGSIVVHHAASKRRKHIERYADIVNRTQVRLSGWDGAKPYGPPQQL